MNRKTMYLVTYLLILIIIFLGGSIAAFLTDSSSDYGDYEIGEVDVQIKIYFEKINEEGQLVEYSDGIDYIVEVEDAASLTKFGVAKINLSNINNIQFIKNFRVDILVYSSVDTYFRVAPYEQLTITYSVAGITREVATTQKKFIDFNYDPNNMFEERRLVDGFYYYKDKVVRVGSDKPYIVPFIGDFEDTADFDLYDDKYSLQIGFIVEAVQALQGPQKVWGMDAPTWKEEW